MKVLLVVNELRTWYIARHVSYAAQLGIEEALSANGVECLTLTTPWLASMLDGLGGKRFDQIWIAGRLDLFDESILARLAELAPIRLAMVSESAEYTPEECAISPGLKKRKLLFGTRLQYFTHIAACDEKDAQEIDAGRGLPAIWWPQSIPARFITERARPPRLNVAVFCGNPYALRREYLRDPELKQLLTYVQSSEWRTADPLLFTALHLTAIWPASAVFPMHEQRNDAYLRRLRAIRRRCFQRWLETLQTGRAVVNLPHFVKTYAGRVVEGMAAGRPVISWEIPDRPQNKALFEDEREILLFPKENGKQLAEQIKRLLRDEELSRKIAAGALNKLRRFHTSEIRVRQILDWLANGCTPRYTE